ncbi:phosphoglycerate mutase-like protein [Wolfiporia cocos MD-104 SS10]|uniref:Phosphoglycerate mutase-like protein n=1 Tax=Wolfiporia cocos (strain MD-104) TaxID=742152 RepID=A0A2H3JJE6_WOLCO|nr:phosphoglycerate mutase-like protein [Wolfiporia cocos MD-104 SS10]
MEKATEKRIFFTRHAQAEHNVEEDYSIPDAPLTALGRQQSAKLHEDTKDTFQQSAELLVTSGLRRTLSTAIIGYSTLRKRLEGEGKTVVVLPQLQECNDLPCDTGSAREVLEADPEYAGLDFSQLTPDWNSKKGFYAGTTAALKARARWNRQWLRGRPEREILVVAHGDCLRYITDGENSLKPWANVEVREYTFKVDEKEDESGEAWLVPVKKIVQEGEDQPTSSSERFVS